MKKTLISLLFVLILWPCIGYPRTYNLLDNATTTGAGNTIYEKRIVPTLWSCDISLTGSPNAVTIRIEGNQGSGNVFSTLGMAEHECTSTELTDGICTFSIVDVPARQFRANVIILDGGINATVSAICTGVE